MRNLKIYILIFAATALISFVIFQFRSYYLFLKEPVAPLSAALSPSTVLVIKTGSLTDLLKKISNSSVATSLKGVSDFQNINLITDSIIVSGNEFAAKLVNSSVVWLSITKNDNGTLSLLTLVSTGKVRQSKLISHINSLTGKRGYNVQRCNGSLYKLSGQAGDIWFYYEYGILALSCDSLTVASSLESVASGTGESSNHDLNKLAETGGNGVDAHVIINNTELHSLVLPQFSQFISNNTPFNSYSAFDVSINENEIGLSGFTLNNGNKLFADQEVVEEIPNIKYPVGTVFNYTLHLSDMHKFVQNYLTADTLHVRGYDKSIKQHTTEIFYTRTHIQGWIGNTVSAAYTDKYFDGKTSNRVIYISVINADSAYYYLNPLIKPVGDSIYELCFDDMAKRLWGDIFSVKGTVYCRFTSGYLLISPDRQLISRENRNITTNLHPSQRRNTGRGSNLVINIKPDFIFKRLNEGKKESSNTITGFLQSIKFISISYNAGSDLHYTHAWIVPTRKNNRKR